MPIWLGQRDARERFVCMPRFGLRSTEELTAHGRVVEQVADFNRGADRAAAGAHVAQHAPGHFQFCTGIRPLRSAANHQLADFCD